MSDKEEQLKVEPEGQLKVEPEEVATIEPSQSKEWKWGDPLPEGIIGRIDLKKPLLDQDGKSHSRLDIREPTSDEYTKFGQPYEMIDFEKGSFKPVSAVCFSYIEASTGIHGALLKKMDARDLDKLCWAVASFFAMG